MKEIQLKELKSIQIEILDEVHRFCQEHSILYFLSSGTLIGAIRHKGYIPWDDDIDLYMPRADYNRFIASFNQFEQLYRIVSLQTVPFCTVAYAKVERLGTRIVEDVDNPMEIGVNIDVFPVDSVPEDEHERVLYFRRIQRIRNRMVLKAVSVNFKRRSLLKNIVLLCGKVLLVHKSLRQLAEQLDGVIDKEDNDSRFVCNVVLGNGIHSVFSRDSISSSVDVIFEGKTYKTMSGYDEYLTKTYGNYMQLPPIEKQVAHHSFRAYWE